MAPEWLTAWEIYWTNRSLCWNQKVVRGYITLPSSGPWKPYSRSFPLVIFQTPVDVIKLPLWKWIPPDAGRGLWWAARNATMLTAKRRKLGSSGFLTFEHYPFPSHLRRRRRGGTEHKPIFKGRTVLEGLRRRLEVWIVLPTRLASGKSPQLFGPATSIMKDLNCQPPLRLSQLCR